jgi:hypothetical protein
MCVCVCVCVCEPWKFECDSINNQATAIIYIYIYISWNGIMNYEMKGFGRHSPEANEENVSQYVH